jgi:hypothetical protein
MSERVLRPIVPLTNPDTQQFWEGTPNGGSS